MCRSYLVDCRWVVDGEWSKCSSSCAEDKTGVSTRLVYCVEELVDGSTQRTLDRLCDASAKPATKRPCNADTVCPKWVSGPWSPVWHPGSISLIVPGLQRLTFVWPSPSAWIGQGRSGLVPTI